MKIVRNIRYTREFAEYIWLFARASFSKKGLLNKNGRLLIWGKFRRIFLTSIPGLAPYLKKKYQLTGGCVQCGASCRILFQCPQLDAKTGNCMVYEDRPDVCRTFPITPADLRDRDRVMHTPCGFKFGEEQDEEELDQKEVKAEKKN